MKERAHVFGSHGGLVGVLCEPDGGVRFDAPAAVFANVGLHHHVGPNRCWVELARALAQAGYASLRFDLSGLGDSTARRDTRSDGERATLDLKEALDFLAARSISRSFVLVANCSGVDSLHSVACSDPRVVGAVSIDGYAYRNAGYIWRKWTIGLVQPSRLRRRLRIRSFGFRIRRTRGAGEAEELWTREIPTREQFGRDLDGLVTRGVRLAFVFTSGCDPHYNHRGQFHEMFGHDDAVQVAFYPQADHILSRAEDRARLVRFVSEWMSTQFPTQPKDSVPGGVSA